MKLGVKAQKWLKAFHVLSAAVWLGAIASSMALLVAAAKVTDSGELQGYFAAASEVGRLVIPLASVTTLLTGLAICGLTSWGFLKYWSVIIQGVAWLLVFLIAVIWLDPALSTARIIASDGATPARQDSRFLEASHLAANLNVLNAIILTITTFIAVIKPWGKLRDSTHRPEG